MYSVAAIATIQFSSITLERSPGHICSQFLFVFNENENLKSFCTDITVTVYIFSTLKDVIFL